MSPWYVSNLITFLTLRLGLLPSSYESDNCLCFWIPFGLDCCLHLANQVTIFCFWIPFGLDCYFHLTNHVTAFASRYGLFGRNPESFRAAFTPPSIIRARFSKLLSTSLLTGSRWKATARTHCRGSKLVRSDEP